MKRKIRLFLLLFTSGCISLMLIFAISALASSEGIYGGVIRLHVLASSDAEDDQLLKLHVRDKVLEYAEESIEECKTLDSALLYLDENLGEIKACAQRAVLDAGYDYEVDVSFCKEYYPTREYENVRLPAGEYLSLRVIIGEGEGKNWWCVLYPPLCTGSARADEELSEAGFSQNQIRLITESENGGYKIKFKIAEVVSSALSKLKKLFR